MFISFKELRQYLKEARAKLIGSGTKGEEHKQRYLDPYVGSQDLTHEVATSHEGLEAGSKVRLHSVYTGNDNKNYAVVSGEDKKQLIIPVTKLRKPGVLKPNKGDEYEEHFHGLLEKDGLVPDGFKRAGFSGGTDTAVENKRTNEVHPGVITAEQKVFHGETKLDTTAAFGQLTINWNKEKGWHIPDKAKNLRPKYAAEIEKAGILDHMNKHVPNPHEMQRVETKREKNIVIPHPNLEPANSYLQDHDVHFLQVGGGYGTYRVGKEDLTGHGFPAIEGLGKWTIREKQVGNKTSRTVMFQPHGTKGLKKSHINLENQEHRDALKRTLGHLNNEKTKAPKEPYEVKIHG